MDGIKKFKRGVDKTPFVWYNKDTKEREVKVMTEFEVIKNALARVRADLNIYDFPNSTKHIHIPVNTLLGNIEIELEFNAEGKLVDTFTWD